MKEISDQNATQQRTGHNPKPHTAKLELSDEISDADCQIHGHFRVFGEKGAKGFHCAVPSLAGCGTVPRVEDVHSSGAQRGFPRSGMLPARTRLNEECLFAGDCQAESPTNYRAVAFCDFSGFSMCFEASKACR